MNKKLTLISALSFAGFAMAQVPQASFMTQKMELAKTIVESKEVVGTEKAPGDILWANNFSSASNWTITNVLGSNAANFGWQLGTAPNQITTWAFPSNTGNFTGGGGYAGCENGNPQTPTHDTDAEWILTYDSVFNFPGVANVLFEFQQYGARFTDKQALEVSTDLGVTWVEVGSNDDITALTANGGAAYTNPTNRSYNVSQALNGAPALNLMFRFRVYWAASVPAGNKGIMYGWFVDNVKFVEGVANDIKLKEAQHLTGANFWQYTKIPASQAPTADVVFSGIISNQGSNAQDVVLTATNGSGLNQNATLTIAGFAQDTIDILTGYNLPATLGTITYSFAATSTNNTLSNTSDDVKTLPIEVTNGVFATDSYTTPALATNFFTAWSSQTGNPGIGNIFEIFVDETAYSVKIGIGNVAAASQATYLGRDFKGVVYEFDDVSGNWTQIAETDFHTLVAADFGKIVTIYFQAGSEPTLITGKSYLVMAESFDTQEAPVALVGSQPSGQTRGKNGPAQTNFISLASSPGSSTVSAPVVRLSFLDDASLTETTLSALSTYPNPTSGSVKVSFDLKTASNVSINVRDLTGRSVLATTASEMNVGSQEMNIDLNAFEAGVYVLEIQAGANKITKQIVKK